MSAFIVFNIAEISVYDVASVGIEPATLGESGRHGREEKISFLNAGRMILRNVKR